MIIFKKIIGFVFLISMFSSCETDTICIDETTPHLIIQFYDKSDLKLKAVTNLKVSVENASEDTIAVFETATSDSIAIPLNVDIDFTKIYLSKNTSETSGITDEVLLNYTRRNTFVSRSCGYKTLYSDVKSTTATDNSWIENVSVLKEIDNENQTHLKIFH